MFISNNVLKLHFQVVIATGFIYLFFNILPHHPRGTCFLSYFGKCFIVFRLFCEASKFSTSVIDIRIQCNILLVL